MAFPNIGYCESRYETRPVGRRQGGRHATRRLCHSGRKLSMVRCCLPLERPASSRWNCAITIPILPAMTPGFRRFLQRSLSEKEFHLNSIHIHLQQRNSTYDLRLSIPSQDRGVGTTTKTWWDWPRSGRLSSGDPRHPPPRAERVIGRGEKGGLAAEPRRAGRARRATGAASRSRIWDRAAIPRFGASGRSRG